MICFHGRVRGRVDAAIDISHILAQDAQRLGALFLSRRGRERERGGVNGRETRFAARLRFAEEDGGAKRCPLLDGGLKAFLRFGEFLEQIRDHDDSLMRKLWISSKFFSLDARNPRRFRALDLSRF